MILSANVNRHTRSHNPRVLLLLFKVSNLIFNNNKSYLISKKQKL